MEKNNLHFTEQEQEQEQYIDLDQEHIDAEQLFDENQAELAWMALHDACM